MKRTWKKPDIDNYVSSLNNLDKKPNADRKRLLLKISQLYLEIEEYKEAQVYTKQYLKLCPNDCKGYKLLAATQEKLGCPKEALKSYRRSSELDPRDVESKECVTRLYCDSDELLFRKKAWLDKMYKELPHSHHTETLRFAVLMEGGQTEELERHLLAKIQRDPLNITLHKQLIKVFKKRGDLKETFHYCCSLSKGGAFYKDLEWLELSLEIMAAYCKQSAEISSTSGEQLVRTADWVLSAQLDHTSTLQTIRSSWITYDACLYTLSKMSHLRTDSRWQQVVQEAQGRLWLHLASLAHQSHQQEQTLNEMNRAQHRVACWLLALVPPPLPASHPSTELTHHRLAVAGLGVSRLVSSNSPTWLGQVITDYCSSNSQRKLLNTYLGPVNSNTSYTLNNPIDGVNVPDKDFTPHCVQYSSLRPLELPTLLHCLSQLAALSTPLALSAAVSNIFPKLPPHPLSLTSLTASDISQSDVCVLLHLLTQFPDLATAKVQNFWRELCYHCKSVSVCPAVRSAATLKSGLWALRGLSNHGLGPLQAIAMAKYFAHRAAELESDRQSVPRDKFSSRSGHYWRVAHTTIKQLVEGTYKRPKDPLFTSRQLEKVELSRLQEETGLAVAGVLVNEGKWSEAISFYSDINTPQAAYNSAQVYMHLAELSNSPNSKNTALEKSKVELALCKDRALDCNDQQILNLLDDENIPDTQRTDVCKQLCFSPTHTPTKDTPKPSKDTPSTPQQSNTTFFSHATEDEICAKLEDLSVNYSTIQAELGTKNSEVELLKEQVKMLKDEMELLKQNVSQYSGSPRDTPPYGTPHSHSTQALYQGYSSPALVNSPRPGQPLINCPRAPPLYPGSPSMVQVIPAPGPIPGQIPGQIPVQIPVQIPGQIPGQIPVQIVPRYPGYPLPAYPVQSLYPGISSQEQFLAPTPEPFSGLAPTPEPFSGLALKEALSSASMGLASSTPVRLNIKPEEAKSVEEVITPPFPVLAPRARAKSPEAVFGTTVEAVFDPSALPTPPPLDTSLCTGGKFSKDIPSVLVPPVLETPPGPDYFSSLLSCKAAEEEEEELCYESQGEEDNELGCSQHFSTGAFTEPDKAVDNRLQRSTSSNSSDVDTTSDFTPLVTLEEVEHRVTGEENEEVVYEGRAKLFRFDACGEWKHRGIGEMKMLVNRTTKVPRLVMRRDFVLNICANHVITPNMTLSPAMNSDKAWLWFTPADLTHDTPEAQQLAARFKTPQIAQEFKIAFESCRDRECLPPAAEPTLEQVYIDGVLDEEIVITYVKEGTEEEQSQARKWQLPDTFYTHTTSCTGCIGCEEDKDEEVTFIKEVLPPTPVKEKAALYQLPPSFYNVRNPVCKGCVGCEDCDDIKGEAPVSVEEIAVSVEETGDAVSVEETGDAVSVEDEIPDLDDSVQITYETSPEDAARAALYNLPPTFYNKTPPCTGCLGCQGCNSVNQGIDDSIEVVYERAPAEPSKAEYYQLPRNFFDPPLEECEGCLGCDEITEQDDEEDEDYTSYVDVGGDQEYTSHSSGYIVVDPGQEEEYTSYGGCGRSDPNEPVSEKPLYDALWPEEITEEDQGQFFTTKEQEGDSQETDIFSHQCLLLQHDPRCGGYKELGSGLISIKSHTERQQFRILFRSDAGKIHANHAIEGGMYIETTKKTKGYVWFVPIDYSDPETPRPERFAAQFEEAGMMKEFVELFKECSAKMKGHSVNHKLVSLLAAGSPRKETSVLDTSVTSVLDTSVTSGLDTSVTSGLDTSVTSGLVNSSYLSNQSITPGKPTSSVAATPVKPALVSTPPTAPSVIDPCAGLRDAFQKEFLSDEVTITKEVVPSKELLDLEVKYQLPRSFYNYVTAPQCGGCLGCEPSDTAIPSTTQHTAIPSTTQPPIPATPSTIPVPATPSTMSIPVSVTSSTMSIPVSVIHSQPPVPAITTPLGSSTLGLASTTPTAFGLNPTTPNFGLSNTNSLYGALPQMDPSNLHNANSPNTPQFGLNMHPSRTATPSSTGRNLFGSPQQNMFNQSTNNIFAQSQGNSNLSTINPTSPQNTSNTPLFATPLALAQVNPFSGPYVSPTTTVGDPADYEDYGDYSSDSDEDYEGYYEEFEGQYYVPEE